MEVIQTEATETKTASRINLEIDHLPADLQEQVKERVGEFLVEQTLLAVGGSKSPVASESFPALSPHYKAVKEAEGGTPVPNLELHGNMLSALDFHKTAEGIEIGVFGKEAPKADGHNNFSGDSSLPQRRFLPDVGQEYRPSIQNEIDKIITDALATSIQFQPSDFSAVTTEAELYDVLAEQFPGMSRAEIRGAVIRSPSLFSMLDDEGLVGLL